MILKLFKNALCKLSIIKPRYTTIKLVRTSRYLPKYATNHDRLQKQTVTMPLMLRTYGCRHCNPPKKPKNTNTTYHRLKQTLKEYWFVTLPIHAISSAFWLGTCYYITECGFNVINILRKLRIPEELIDSITHSSMGALTVTFALYKLATPFRYATTYVATVMIVRSLIERGLLEEPPKRRMFNKNKMPKPK